MLYFKQYNYVIYHTIETIQLRNIGRYHVLTTVLYYTLKSTPKKVSLYHRNGLTMYMLYT